jgi:pantoate--beta-alanine ligase
MFRGMKTPEIFATIVEMRARVAGWRGAGQRVGLVPTMGALHAGHLSLVKESQSRADQTIVSIFVNPAQFAPHEDFDRYPRRMDADAAMLGDAADLIFAPSVAEMYPEGFATRIEVGGPSSGLETDFRPHFFSGVATVVAKLLIAAMPDVAIFGEKDWQQLQVIRRLVADLALPIEIVGAPILREPDGLAMSSRNAYLETHEREIAGRMNVVLRNATAESEATQELLKAGFDSVDYVAIRDAATLGPVGDGPKRILAAAKIGATRLIDNMAV